MQATRSERAPLGELTHTPYIQILTYPRISLRAARSRIGQLKRLGVDSLIFEGKAKIGRLGILGVGTVGIVVKCSAGGTEYALKIRRTDANRPNLTEEYKLTVLANRAGVGATVHAHEKDFILLTLLEYEELSDWLRQLRGEGSRARAKEMIHALLNQCRKLDIIGLDHGQLSNLRKHAVVAEERPWIIDFESASRERKPKNVTAAAQCLLVGGKISPLVRRTLGVKDTVRVLGLLRDYKEGLSDFAYAKMLEGLRLAPP